MQEPLQILVHDLTQVGLDVSFDFLFELLRLELDQLFLILNLKWLDCIRLSIIHDVIYCRSICFKKII